MYEVIKRFVDLQDDNHLYNVGDSFPRDGYAPSERRIALLLGEANRQKTPLIKDLNPTQSSAQPDAESGALPSNDNGDVVATAEPQVSAGAPTDTESEGDADAEGDADVQPDAQADTQATAEPEAEEKEAAKGKKSKK